MHNKPDRLEKQQITFSDNEQQSSLSILRFSSRPTQSVLYSNTTTLVLYTNIQHNGNKRQDHLIL